MSQKLYQLTTETIKNETTEELMSLYIYAKDSKVFSFSALNNAIRLDVTDRKMAAAKRNYEADKARFQMVLNELKSRGVTKVVRSN